MLVLASLLVVASSPAAGEETATPVRPIPHGNHKRHHARNAAKRSAAVRAPTLPVRAVAPLANDGPPAPGDDDGGGAHSRLSNGGELAFVSSFVAGAMAEPAAPPPSGTVGQSLNPGSAASVVDDDGVRAHSRLSYGGEVDFLSSFVWRGVRLNQGPVLQPSMDLSVHDFHISSEANLVLWNDPEAGRFNVADVALSYTAHWRRFSFEPIAQLYVYPYARAKQSEAPVSVELAFKIACELGRFSLFTEHAADVVAHPGAYFGLVGARFEYEWKILTVAVGVNLGFASAQFNQLYFGVPRTTANLAGAEASLTLALGRYVYLRPHGEAIILIDPGLREAADSANNFVGGLATGINF